MNGFSSLPPSRGAKGSAVGTTANPSTTSATFVAAPEMSVTRTTHGREVEVFFSTSAAVAATALAGDSIEVALFVDGVEVPDTVRRASIDSGLVASTVVVLSTESGPLTLAKGSHTFEARYRRPGSNGAAKLYSTLRRLTVVELY